MTTHEVQLAIYDLSRGMARTLSAQFLGPNHAIDIIPHTAIVAYGREYYFGAGIESADPIYFRRSRQIFPTEVQTLGRTSRSQSEFEAWCREVAANGRYGPLSYDLLTRNCNNFAHDAAREGLRLSKGVPDWVLGVPQRFLSSPMGQMLRPMLEQMQITGSQRNPVNAPFAGAGDGQFSSAGSQNVTQPSRAPPVVPAANPWANISPAATSAVSSAAQSTPKVAKATAPNTPVLDSYNRPLVSNDTNTVNICIKKLDGKTNGESPAIGISTDDVNSSLQTLEKLLVRTNTAATTSDSETLRQSSKALLSYLDRENAGSDLVFALMLLRLIVLHPLSSSCSGDDDALIVKTVGKKLTEEHSPNSSNPLVKSSAARSMAWCVLSNAMGSDHKGRLSVEFLYPLVDAAIVHLSIEQGHRVEVRQAASAFLYNVSLLEVVEMSNNTKGDDDKGALPDLLVSLLCGTLEGIHEEPDATTRLRRLLVSANVVRSSFYEKAKALVTDLGFSDDLDALTCKNHGRDVTGDAKKVAEVADEFRIILSSV